MKFFNKLSLFLALLSSLNLTSTYCMEEIDNHANIATYKIDFKYNALTVDVEVRSNDTFRNIITKLSNIFLIPFANVAIISGGDRIDNNGNLDDKFLDPNVLGDLNLINSFRLANSPRI